MTVCHSGSIQNASARTLSTKSNRAINPDSAINVNSIKGLLQIVHQHDASDLHLSAGLPAMMRVDGDMVKIDMPALNSKTTQRLIFDIMTDKQRTDLEHDLETDFSFAIENLARFRVNVFTQDRGLGAVFRTIPSQVINIEGLKVADVNTEQTLKNIANYNRGLVLVTGPTGSGKTTTLAAIIDHINQHRKAHILTIEDPVEFVHHPKNSLINQREVHRDTRSFQGALRSALREDPDVILVGELRDLETIRLALTAAETGHLVLATLHTSSAAKTINRIIDVFAFAEKDMIRAMLSESLQAVVSQTLVKRRTGGRVAACEIMLATPAIRNLIRENKVAQMYSVIQTGAALGMTTLDNSLKNLVASNIVSKEAARAHASRSELFV